MEYDHATPYGHVASNARPESRLLVRVTVRPGHMGQMLNDGRVYPSGTHDIQIYRSELSALQKLVETRESDYQSCVANLSTYVADWCAQTKRSEAECPISAESQFRQITLRDVLPLQKVEVLRELDTIEIEHERKRAAAIAETAAQVATPGANDAILAGVVSALEKLNAKLDSVAQQRRG